MNGHGQMFYQENLEIKDQAIRESWYQKRIANKHDDKTNNLQMFKFSG